MTFHRILMNRRARLAKWTSGNVRVDGWRLCWQMKIEEINLDDAYHSKCKCGMHIKQDDLTFTYWQDVDIACWPRWKRQARWKHQQVSCMADFNRTELQWSSFSRKISRRLAASGKQFHLPTSRHRTKSIKGTNKVRLFSVSDFYCSQTIFQTLWTTQKNMNRDWNRIRREIVGSDSI